MDDKGLSEAYDFAVQLGKDAGKMLLDAAWSRINGTEIDTGVDQKESSVDIVTKTDYAVEEFIRQAVATKFPHHSFLGEETYSAGDSRKYLVTSSPTWIVDPLDGTVNFTHLFPMFCVSIAFCINGYPVIGVINAPFMNQFFSSCKGRGSWLNESHRLPLMRSPVPPLPKDAPSGCTFACEWGKDRRDDPNGNLARKVHSFATMALERKGRGGTGGMVHGVRSLGSATLDLAYTAMGSIDIWWEGGCWEWDVAAGIAILEEAGGIVTTANPPPDPVTARITKVGLGDRLYLAIRPAGNAEEESGVDAQHRVVRQVWQRVEGLDYERPYR
ncbi:hypothetical protein QQS21_009917 [Conoideocrella luteorostrata]|uniref:Inositol-1-monophosphatase n=1 Tax=Conoideocrella luteorostrata TaxID=1105319 RepID=A0AAJ0CIE4_9HYPO|nr:hypothetical protein QQS21_009917 [Conoideocrella luteorostrata]